MKLYVSTKQPAHWYTIGTHNCTHCDTILNYSCIASIKWMRGDIQPDILLFCHSCIKKRELVPYNHFASTNTLLSLLPIIILSQRTNGLRVWVPFPPDFSAGRISSIDAANPNNDNKLLSDADGYEIDDQTVYAGRESFEGAQIGVVDKPLLDDLDKPIQLDDVKKYLRGKKNE